MIAWFARNSVAANLMMITIVTIGLFSLFRFVPLEIFPTIEAENIRVNMSLRGATPEEVEQSVSIKIEEAIADLEGIKHITSTSKEGSSSVNIEVDKGYDARKLLSDVKSRVDAINTFPSDAEKPVIELAIRKRNVMLIALASIYDEKQTRQFAQTIRNEILQIDGISQIEFIAIRDFEITIEVSQDRLKQYNLTMSDISTAINNSSLNLSAGNLRTISKDILVSTKKQSYTKDEFGSIIIKSNLNGSSLLLSDIAEITDGFEESPVRSKYNGKNAIFIDVFRVGNESAIDVATKAKDYIAQKQETLPKGYSLNYWDDDSKIVKNRLETLGSSALQGSILILILLTLFLRPAIAFWVFIGIPISFAGAFILMPFFGVSLNVLSLFGFILVLGIVVDDAIVTGENIYTHLRKSESGEMAAINGTKEIAIPVTFGVLTTIVAFIPLVFVEGQRSNLFNQIPYIVIPVLIFSLIESKLILPAHLKYIKLRGQKNKTNRFEQFQQKFADGFERTILKYYYPVLKLALENKLTTLTIFISALALIISLIISGWTKFIYFPRIPSETIRMSLEMPAGTAFDITNQHIVHATKQVKFLREKYRDTTTGESIILNVMTTTGGRGGTSNVGSVRFEITPPEEREIKISTADLAKEWRELIGDIPGAQSLTFRSELGRSSSPIDIQVTGTSLSTLKEIASKVKEHLKTYETTFDITDSLSDGKDELGIELTKEGKLLGLNDRMVINQLKGTVYGLQVQRIQRGREDVRVMLRLPRKERDSIATLNEILITTPNGTRIPFGNIAQLKIAKAPSAINRIDRFRTVNIQADIEKNNTNMIVLERDLKSFLDALVVKYPNIKYSLEGESREQQETFSSLFYSLLLALFAIYVLLAVPFKSYIQPFIVMSVIPFGIIGAIVGHWIMGMPLTILSVMGMIALAGILVNDSLVLVDYINKQYKKTGELMESILTAGSARFRPVILTSLTTFIGLLPLLFEKSTQAQFLIPMATSLAFGIIFATLTTLILLPIFYVLMENMKLGLSKVKY